MNAVHAEVLCLCDICLQFLSDLFGACLWTAVPLRTPQDFLCLTLKSLFPAATSVKWVELHGIVHLYTTGLIYQDRCKNAGALIKSVAFCQIL